MTTSTIDRPANIHPHTRARLLRRQARHFPEPVATAMKRRAGALELIALLGRAEPADDHAA